MEIRDILLFVRAGADNAALVAVAGRLARGEGAMVTGVCLCPDPEPTVAEDYAVGSPAVVEVVEHRHRALRAMIEPVEAAYAAAIRDPGCSAGWMVSEPEEPPRLSALRARTFDLTIVHRPGPQDHRARDLAETLVTAGGTPTLMIPRDAGSARFARAVLAWNGSAQARRALGDALALLRHAAAVQVLIVESEATAWVDEAEGEALLRHLARHRIDAQVRRLPASHDAGETMLRACEDFAADLLVMGAFHHSRGVEAILGGATKTALSHAPIPVLMSR